jgi:hypothetical protein
MGIKEKKSEAELARLIMGEVRKYPECNRVNSVGIIRPVQQASHHPNWNAAFTVDGNEEVPERASRVARELQAKFDLA